MAENQQASGGFLAKKISLKTALILIGVIVVVGLWIWLMQYFCCRSDILKSKQALLESRHQMVVNLATTIAVVGNSDISAGKIDDLQAYADAIVKQKPITYIAIIDTHNKAVVNTDRRFIGETMPKPDPDNVFEASVPVMHFTRQVATVRVGIAAEQLSRH